MPPPDSRPAPRAEVVGDVAVWPGYAVAVWGVVFAFPSFVWAMGGTLGASSTVSPSLVKLARDGVWWFLLILWLTGFLKLFAAAVGIGLTRVRGRRLSQFLIFCGCGGAVVLVWHGLLFVVHGILVHAGAITAKPDVAHLTNWYMYLWGPYFVLGGVAFGIATAGYFRRHDDPRDVQLYGTAGALAAALLSLMSTLSGVG